MRTLTTTTTVGEAVADNIKRVKVFQQHGIDFCCGGKVSLEHAAGKKGLAVDRLIEDLKRIDQSSSPDDIAWTERSIPEIVEHVLITYHEPLKAELPRLHQMLKKVASVHGPEHPELPELFSRFTRFESEMYHHMAKEENVLFPMCVDLATGTNSTPGFCSSVEGPIRVMLMEHDDAGEFFAVMNRLTDGLTPPPGACNTYRASFDGLKDLEREMHLHIHMENNVLFPKALAAEQASHAAGA